MYKCPDCGCQRFSVEQHLKRYVVINEKCEVVEVEEENIDETLSLNDWMCMECGYQGHDYEFEIDYQDDEADEE